MPLLVEKELDDSANRHLRGELCTDLFQRARLTARQFLRPGIPALFAIAITKRVVEDKVFEPPVVLGAELFKARLRGSSSRVKKLASRFHQQRQLAFVNLIVIDRTGGIWKRSEPRGVDPTALRQSFQAHQ